MYSSSIKLNAVLWALSFILLSACSQNESKQLSPVTYAQFEAFVNETGYVTDAEKYGWSIVQINVEDFITVENANWRKPDGKTSISSSNLPVTQVSYNDALAYCKWAKKRLPTYDEYWAVVESDDRPIVSENAPQILEIDQVNVVGNVWDITAVEDESRINSVRLAGGSLFCSKTTCHGTVKERRLFVDKETGNIHIGFSVIDAGN